ncbi:MAG: M20/M25/M40 family metallo-hydrolase, partial [Verrucomicrobiales bacterium]
MDHPGWVRRVGGDVECGRLHDGFEFLGGVPAAFLAKPNLKKFGDFAMWDLPALEQRDGLIHSRACDDLVNCATILAAFDSLEARGVEAAVHAVFTRAEEVGFVGAVELARRWPYPEGAVFVSLETSAPVPGVEIGGGPVLRVGDRLSIFDHCATGHFARVAAEAGIEVQRCLLDRGACEATAIQAYGIPAAGMSIALGNYHNCGPGSKIEAEFISRDDYFSMVALVAAIVESPPAGGDQPAIFFPGAGV